MIAMRPGWQGYIVASPVKSQGAQDWSHGAPEVGVEKR